MPVSYPDVKVIYNDKQYPALNIDNTTYYIWTLARDMGLNITKIATNDVEISGHKPTQYYDGHNTYLCYSDIPEIHLVKLPDKSGWKAVKRTIAPSTPAPSVNPLQGYSILASAPGKVVYDAFTFNLTIIDKSGKELGQLPMTWDTGAFEFTIEKTAAAKFGLVDGKQITIGGVGGQDTAYMSKINFKMGDRCFYDVDCIIGSSDAVPNLFGLRFLVDNYFSVLIDTVKQVAYLLKGPQIEIADIGWSQSDYKVGTQGIWTAHVTVEGQPAPDGTILYVQIGSYPKTAVHTTGGKLDLYQQLDKPGSLTITAFANGEQKSATAKWQ